MDAGKMIWNNLCPGPHCILSFLNISNRLITKFVDNKYKQNRTCYASVENGPKKMKVTYITISTSLYKYSTS